MTSRGRFRSVRVLRIAALAALAVSAAGAATENPFARPLRAFPLTPSSLLDVNGVLYFVADDGVRGAELWKSDGTEEGTVRVADIAAGTAGSSPASLLRWGDKIAFTADDGVHGRELWTSDGTDAGTVPAKDVLPGADGSAPASLVVMRDRLYFSADDGVHGRELWTSDGTDAGTSLVKDIRPGPVGAAPDSIINQPWIAIRSGDPFVRVYDGVLIFAADDGVAGREVWMSDGTDAGTALFVEIRPGPEGSDPTNLFARDYDFAFVADDGVLGVAPWVAWGPGVDVGTWPLQGKLTGPDGKSASYVDRVGDYVVFDNAYGEELWVVVRNFFVQMTDEVRIGELGSSPRSITSALGGAVFSADDGVSGRELWLTYPMYTQQHGVRRIADIAPGAADSDPRSITEASGLTVVFSADDGAEGHGRELWASDGTEAGTRMLQDIVPGAGGSDPSQFTNSGRLLFFTAANPVGGSALYVADRPRVGGRVSESDFDGDGFVDDVETAAGSSTVDPESTPEGLAAPRSTSVIRRVSVRLDFANAGADTLTLAGVGRAPRTFSSTGKRAYVDFGGVVRSFTLDARGVGVSPQGDRFVFRTSPRTSARANVAARWSAKFAPSGLASTLAPYGFTDPSLRGARFPLTYVFVEGVGVVFSESPETRWRARRGHLGVAHLRRPLRF